MSRPPAGIVVLDKPAGVTSNRATRKVQRLFGARRAGHLGTLDPFATGVLPVMIEEATRLGPFLEGGEKTYVARLVLGVTTDTLDREGVETGRRPVPADAVERLRAAIPSWIGAVRQRVPDYSAAKVGGVRRCDLVRAGRDVPIAEKEVVVRDLRMLDASGPEATIEVTCGPGTFVRQLAADLGEAVGCGAHTVSLHRTRSGPFSVDGAVTIDRIVQTDPAARPSLFADLGGALPGRAVEVDAAMLADLEHGRAIDPPEIAERPDGETVLVVAGGVLRAIAVVRGGRVHPRRLLGRGVAAEPPLECRTSRASGERSESPTGGSRAPR